MWIENKILREDLEYVVSRPYIKWQRMENKTVLVTGGTGLIGSYFINSLLYYNRCHTNKIHVVALVRDCEKARIKFKRQLEEQLPYLKLIQGAVENLPKIDGNIDFILHAASPTSSSFFVANPVETILISIKGTWNLLRLAIKKHAEGMVYLSSMEVYGPVHSEEKVGEMHPSYIDTMSARNSYPESKRLCESLCASYYKEYKVPVNCIRLTQTFGPGIRYDDQRILFLFIYCIRFCLRLQAFAQISFQTEFHSRSRAKTKKDIAAYFTAMSVFPDLNFPDCTACRSFLCSHPNQHTFIQRVSIGML